MGITVIGSLNMDMVLAVRHHVKPGETLLADGVDYSPGGKGANQAVAAARMGAPVRMAGRVGDDQFGSELLRFLRSEKINTDNVQALPGVPTGLAMISVNPQGENSIVIVSGANGAFAVDDIPRELSAPGTAEIVMLQLEVPLDAVRMAAIHGKAQGAYILLDPAPVPAGPLPSGLLDTIDLLMPNQIEAEHLTGIPVTDPQSAETAARKLLAMGPRQVIVKLGKAGAIVADGQRLDYMPGIPVQTVDSTAAGDAFAGALAAVLHEGKDLFTAAAFANRAAAISTTRHGAMVSIPRRGEIEQV